jgi:hypothetical protein
VTIIGDMAQALTNHGSRIKAQSKEGLTRLVDESPEALQFKVGTLPMMHIGINQNLSN